MGRIKLYFILIVISTMLMIYTNLPRSIKSFKTSMISSLQRINSSLNSSSLLLPLITDFDQSFSKTKYIVNTEMCRMIDWPLFDAETRPLFRNHSGRRIKCRTSETNLLNVKRVDQTVIQIDYVSDIQSIPQCFATQLVRKRGQDSSVTFGQRVGPIKQTINITDCNVVRITCFKTLKKSSVKLSKRVKYLKSKIFDRIVPLIPEKNVKTKNSKTVKPNTPNVLMLGIDSISWLNFKRQFTLTKSLAEEHNFYPIYGYNKIGDNTFPNLMGVLTGHFYDTFWNESLKDSMYFDELPFIWKEFDKINFITAFIEDLPRYSLFNYKRKGFIEEPTDYYLRPVSLAINSQLKRYCYKDMMEIDFYFNYTLDLLRALRNRQQKYFVFEFMAHLTHNNANYAGYADLPVYSLLSKLFAENLMNDTILFLFSDHGIRFGKWRSTASGTIEERLPFVYLYLPDSYKTETFHKNLITNSHRLTTPFDIYATLLHITRGNSVQNLSHGKSLLDEIPLNRSCDTEQISQHWCVCSQHNLIDNNRDVRPIAKFVVSEVNRLLRPVSTSCVKLVLSKILSTYESTGSAVHLQKFYLIRIEVKPSFAIFEATVRQMFDKMTIIGEISRINEYGMQSICIDNSLLQKYCFCKSIVKRYKTKVNDNNNLIKIAK